MIRRDFIRKTGLGIAGISVGSQLFSQAITEGSQEKPLVIGIIGAENSHTAKFGKLFNIDKKIPGVEVRYVWGETDEFARDTMAQGKIPYQVKDPLEMLGKIDALIVDHRHPKYHLAAATPFVKAKIPVFVDKPFCYRAAEGKEFLQLAKKYGTPVSSYSLIAHSDSTFDMKEQIASMKDLTQVVMTGTAELDSPYGGIFFYGAHLVEPMIYMFGDDVSQVRISKNGNTGNASIRFKSGLFATLIIKKKAYGWATFVEAGDKFSELKSRVQESDPPKNYTDMVHMFRTGELPRPYQNILNGISILEALEKSSKTEAWTDVKYVHLDD
jgi:predicted dehydrogenase